MALFHYLAWTNTLAFGPTMTVFRQHRRKKSVTKSLHPHQPVGTAAMRKASKSQPPLEEGKCRQRSPSPPHRRLRSQHSSESAARTCHPCAMRYDFVGRHENLQSRPRPRPPRRRASVTRLRHAARGRAQHAAAQWVRLRIPQVHTRACSLGASVALFAAALSMALPLPPSGDLICTAGCPTDA